MPSSNRLSPLSRSVLAALAGAPEPRTAAEVAVLCDVRPNHAYGSQSGLQRAALILSGLTRRGLAVRCAYGWRPGVHWRITDAGREASRRLAA